MPIYKRKRCFGKIAYLAVVHDKSGKQSSKTFSKAVDAEAWETKTRFEVQANSFSAPVKCELSVQDLFDQWDSEYARFRLENSSRIRYLRHYNFQIKPEFGKTPIRKVSRHQIEAWFRKMRIKWELSVKSANEALSLLKRLLEFALDKAFITANPARPIKLLPTTEQAFEFWTKSEAVQFLDYARKVNHPLYQVFLMALTTGMRLGEIVGLKWDAVCLTRQQITVKRTWCLTESLLKETTKTKKIRALPINRSLLLCLEELKQRSQGDFLFKQTDSSHLSHNLRSLARKSGVKEIRFHDLRHSFASQFMMAGGNIYDLQMLLGHTSMQMTERYSHLSPNHLFGKTECLNF